MSATFPTKVIFRNEKPWSSQKFCKIIQLQDFFKLDGSASRFGSAKVPRSNPGPKFERRSQDGRSGSRCRFSVSGKPQLRRHQAGHHRLQRQVVGYKMIFLIIFINFELQAFLDQKIASPTSLEPLNLSCLELSWVIKVQA